MKKILHSRICLVLLMVVAVIACAYFSLHQHQHLYLTRQGAALSESSLRILQEFDQPVDITAYVRRNPKMRRLIRKRFAPYVSANPQLQLQFVNPDFRPSEVRARRIEREGDVFIEYQGRGEKLTALNERGIVQSLNRLLHQEELWLALLDGHGERRFDSPANHQWQMLGEALQRNRVRTTHLELSSLPAVPQNIRLLVIADPQTPLQSHEILKIVDFLYAGGNLLYTVDTSSDKLPDFLQSTLGVQLLPGRVIDPDASRYRLDNPSNLVLERLPNHPFLKNLQSVLLLPGSKAFAAAKRSSEADSDWQMRPLLQSSPNSRNLDGEEELTGILPLALDFVRPFEQGEQHIVLLGDSDLWASQYIGNGDNLNFGLSVFNALLTQDELFLPSTQPPDQQIHMSAKAWTLIGIIMLLVLPAVCLLIAWALYRHRRACEERS